MSDSQPDVPDDGDVQSFEDMVGSSYTALQMDALYMHELFTAFTSAGFTELQALRLTSFFFMEGGVGVSVTMDDDFDDTDFDDDQEES